VRDDRFGAVRKRPTPVARRIAFRHEHRIASHVDDDATLALVRRLARRRDVHDEAPNAAVGREGDVCVPLAHAWKSVDVVDRQRVAATHHALDGDRVVAESGNESVPFGGLDRAAAGERAQPTQPENESLHARTFRGQCAARKTIGASVV
jgi:hypothetical protein